MAVRQHTRRNPILPLPQLSPLSTEVLHDRYREAMSSGWFRANLSGPAQDAFYQLLDRAQHREVTAMRATTDELTAWAEKWLPVGPHTVARG